MVAFRTTDNARWGAGKGSNLTATEIDLNFWELLERLIVVETNPAEPNEIASFTVTGSQLTVHMADGTEHGPLTLPTALIRFREDWTPASAYFELDLVTVPGDGLYLVLADHESGAVFDPVATDGSGNLLYRWLLPIASAFSVSEEGALVLAAPSDLNFVGAGVAVADDGDGTVTVTIDGGGGAAALGDLTDVALNAPAAADYLRFDGAAWVDAPLAWGDIPDVPAAFPPTAHGHDWSEISGRPATIDALPAAVGAAGTVLKAGAGGTITWGTDETGAGGGVTTFLGLDDTPGAFGTAGQLVAVNPTTDALEFIDPPAGGGASALDDLTDVAIAAAATGHFLGYDGAGWVNMAVDWSDLSNVPATFPPAAHNHTAAEISDFAEALDDRVAALLVAGDNITLTYDDGTGSLTIDAAGGSGGGGGGSVGGSLAVTGATVATGAFTTGAWAKRPIGATPINSIDGATVDLGTDEVTLPAGTYDAFAFADFWRTATSKIRLYDVTNSAVLLEGDDAYSINNNISASVKSVAFGRLTLAAETAIRLEYFVENGTTAALGNGAPTGSGAANIVAGMVFNEVAAGGGSGGAASLVGFYADREGGTAQAIPSSTTTVKTYTNEVYDTEGAFDPATGIFTVPASLNGQKMVLITGTRLASNATVWASYIKKNGAIVSQQDGAGISTMVMPSAPIDLATGDEIRADVWINAAKDLSGMGNNFFAGYIVGAAGGGGEGGGGAATFLDLTDTPAAFGTPGQMPVVNATGDALEFADPSTGDVEEAPIDGQLYGRADGGWATIDLPVPAGHYRYWRLRLISEDQLSGTNAVYLSEIEFRAVAGVAEPATGGTVFGNFGAVANLFNGNNTTAAQTPEPYTDKVAGYDFGAPRTVEQVSVQSANNLAVYAPSRFVIEASNDDVTYTEVARADPIAPAWSGVGIVTRQLTVSIPLEPVPWDALTDVPANIDAIGGLASAADTVPYFTGAGAAAVAPLTTLARALLDDADAAAMRSTLELGDIATEPYEEGTFTPVVVGATSPGTATYTLQLGNFQRVGNRCSAQIHVAWSGHTGTGTLRVGGLPFAVKSGVYSPALFRNADVALSAAGKTLQGYANSAATFIEVEETDGTGAVAGVAVDAAGSMIIFCNYEVA